MFTTTATAVTAARRSGTAGRMLVSLGVVGAAAAVAGLGTFGTFTSTTSGSEAVSTGTVAIALGGNGGLNNLSVPASNLVAGDTVQRTVTLANTGSADLAGVTLTTAATTSSKLDTDAVNGLQLRIDSCATAWTQSTPTSAATCAGGATAVVATRAVIGTNVAVNSTRALTAGANDNLLVTLTLAQAADNTFQGQSSAVGFTFTGTQRAATNR